MPPRPFHVLSLSGGGFLGLYSAVVLEGLERRAGLPLARCFDLVAGTSIGGVLAIALAFELPMAQLVQLFVQHGPNVFSDRALPTGRVARLIDLSRSVLGPKYSGAALRDALAAQLGERTNGQRRLGRGRCGPLTAAFHVGFRATSRGQGHPEHGELPFHAPAI